MTTPKDITIKPAKGRPMLTWVGKRPLRRVTAFPAQLVERFSADSTQAGAAKRKAQDDDGGLLFHGDNKEVLAYLLANGYRGKINLVYIDPPFDSGADYVRKVQLRGPAGIAKLDGESYTLGEQIQYTDIWANDNYLQFMYERLLLQRELLAEHGVMILHCDWKKSHHLRCLLDEVFGPEQFRNEVYWYFYNKMHDDRKDILPRATNTLFVYSKGAGSTFHKIAVPREKTVRQLKRVKVDGILVNLKDEEGNLVYQDSDARTLDNIWPIPLIPPADVKQKTDYPTQKPVALIELAVHAYSNPGDLVLDCFVGSGTTAMAAQRLGRRWIACDINKGAIQTTTKRLQAIMSEQASTPKQVALMPDGDEMPPPAQLSFAVYRVNDYDLQIQHNEAVNLACEHLGITRTKTDGFFDGTRGKKLVKIVPFNHPLTPLDLEEIKRELSNRPDETRDVLVVCLGKQLDVEPWLESWNAMRKKGDVPNKLDLIELRTDPQYGHFFEHQPARVRLTVKRAKGKLKVTIQDFISPSILERLKQQAGILSPQIDDWRAMVDSVMIDGAFDGHVFNIVLADVPERKSDLVSGEYELAAPTGPTTVAVKITDMLGEEVLEERHV
jgi:DNA modification methylase